MYRKLSFSHLILGEILLSITLGLTPASHAAPPINSINDGRIINGGTYFNTDNAKTTFVNSHSGGLWLKSGITVRGLEVNPTHALTNNGGTIQLSAPGQVVRVDGNINVNGLINGQGAFLGNGGKVFIDSAYLYQNGKISAVGKFGGDVQIFVNAVTFGPLSKIDVSGTTWDGGTINISGSGVVNLQKGALINTSGTPTPGLNSNLILISGPVVNNAGVIKANGISASVDQDSNATNGGVIQLFSTDSKPDLQPVVNALAGCGIFSRSEGNAIISDLRGLANGYADTIRNTGSITADGGTTASQNNNGGNGGGILLETAHGKILNLSTGLITANGGFGIVGGHGGGVVMTAQDSSSVFRNEGQMQANGGTGLGGGTGTSGIAGDGGSISLGNLVNSGAISANGGDGATYTGGRGGHGGALDAMNLINQLSGTIRATGGAGSGQSNGSGGMGGHMTFTNFTNNGVVSLNGGVAFGLGSSTAGDGGHILGANMINRGTVSVDGGASGGRGVAKGGIGGRIKITSLTNFGLVTANGGSGDNGGDGGLLSFNKATNTGTLTANGGSTYFNSYRPNLAAGDGGTIIGIQVLKSGTVEALGGTSEASPTLNGQAGDVIGF